MCTNGGHTYKHLILLMMRFLDEHDWKESVQTFELESKLVFNMRRFVDDLLNSDWLKAERYLSAFTNIEDNCHSKRLFFELTKQRYFDALNREDHALALFIFENQLKMFSAVPNRISGELRQLSSLMNLRKKEREMSSYMNTTSTRVELCEFMKQLIRKNPILADKIEFSYVEKSALLSLISFICPKNNSGNIMKELIYLIMQFLDEENFKQTRHKLEMETKVYFDMDYLHECMLGHKWDQAETYLSAFTKECDNMHSRELFSEIRKKRSEAADRKEEFHLNNCPTNNAFEAIKLTVLVKVNPLLNDKLKFPSMDKSRLKYLIELVMKWWTPYCSYMKANASNEAISLKDIPTVTNLFHSSQEDKTVSDVTGARQMTG